MQEGGEFRQFVLKMADTGRPERKFWDRFRETLDTAILGTLSTTLGVLVIIIGVRDVLGIPRVGWLELVHGRLEPLTMLGIVVIVGEILGVAGLAVGQMRGGVIPPLCAVGTIVCLVQMFSVFGQFLLLSLR